MDRTHGELVLEIARLRDLLKLRREQWQATEQLLRDESVRMSQIKAIMTPQQRSRQIAQAVLEDIAPRLARGEGPVDIDALEQRIVTAIMEAVAEVRDSGQIPARKDN